MNHDPLLKTILRSQCQTAGAMAALLIATGQAKAVTVLSDDFNRVASDTVGTTPVGNLPWHELENAAGDIKVNANELRLGSGDTARRLVTVNLSATAGYESVLGHNPGLVTWTFNLSGGTYMDGFDDGKRGTAFLLAASEASRTDGSGYAVAYGDSIDSSSIQLRLIRYAGGLDADANLTTLITTGSLFRENSAHRFGVKVTFNPANNAWRLYADENAWSEAWPDPQSAPEIGSFTDATLTGESLPFAGVYLNPELTSVYTYADNLALTVVPEPSAWGAVSALGLVGYALWSRRRGVAA